MAVWGVPGGRGGGGGAGLGEGLREKLPHPRLPLTLAGEAPEPVSLCSSSRERNGEDGVPRAAERSVLVRVHPCLFYAAPSHGEPDVPAPLCSGFLAGLANGEKLMEVPGQEEGRSQGISSLFSVLDGIPSTALPSLPRPQFPLIQRVSFCPSGWRGGCGVGRAPSHLCHCHEEHFPLVAAGPPLGFFVLNVPLF